MLKPDKLEEIEKRRKEWKEGTLRESLKRFKTSESPNRFYTPADIPDFDFLEKIGFPGEYPYTAGVYPTMVPGTGPVKGGSAFAAAGLARAGRYSGYATAEDTRDYYRDMIARGWRVGPNLAFDLPTQCGYDPDHPLALGEVGRTGVAVTTLRDMETILEPFEGALGLDRVAINMNINAPAAILIAMVIAAAGKKGITPDKLHGTPQNDILKEYTGRGTYIFPPRPSLRLTRDSFVYLRKNVPSFNLISISSHFREAGADSIRSLGYQFANAIAYAGVAQEAGLDLDDVLPHFTFQTGGCHTMQILQAIAEARASRRAWARIARERLGTRNPKSWVIRTAPGRMDANLMTMQRPLNNLVRTVLGGVAIALTESMPVIEPGFDEPLGLGISLEAQQLSEDAARIMFYEAKLCEVTDPFAGSYYMEALTDRVEAEIWKTMEEVERVGGAVAAIETGYLKREVARNAYQIQKDVETGKRIIVGVNAFVGPEEIDVRVLQSPHPYDPGRRRQAEENQIAKLKQVKKERDNERVAAVLNRLREEARDERVNLFPTLIEAVTAYATTGEICGVLREVFGEHEEYGVI